MPRCATIPGWLLLVAAIGCAGPLGPIAGGRLSGEPAELPDDWSFARDVMIVQLETRPDSPYSVNLGFVDYAGAVYVGSEKPFESTWVANLVADPRVRLRVEDRVYEMRADRVTDENEWVASGRVFFAKYDLEFEPDHEPGWMIRLSPR